MQDTSIECACAALHELAVEGFGTYPSTRTHERIARRGSPYWWLNLSVCRVCGQHWLIAQEERMNDVYIMRKLTSSVADRARNDGVWPDEFDKYETLLQIGPAHGHVCRFANATSAIPIAIDLVGQRPDITNAEIAKLVNISETEVQPIASHARAEVLAKGYPYPWQPA